MPAIRLKCSCGKVQGKTESVDSESGSRIACCCRDCQTFTRYLGKEEATLDEYGGTDIFQMPVSHLKITDGNDQIACLRLSEKGLYRWYTRCCNTPIGNTMGAKGPFIGVIHNFMDHSNSRDEDLGRLRGYGLTKFAKEEVPKNKKGSSIGLLLRTIRKLLTWKLKGLNRPSAFFDDSGTPLINPNVLSEEFKKQLMDN